MRVPLPTPTLLRQVVLRAEAQARLATRAVLAEARLGDPTDPGWLLIEEAAWRVETLSRDASADPETSALAIALPLGARPRPAVPALGVVTLQVSAHGALHRDEAWTFLTPHSETVAGLHFVLLEPSVPVVQGSLAWAEGGLSATVTLSPAPKAPLILRLGLAVPAGGRCPAEASADGQPVPCKTAWRLKGGADGLDLRVHVLEVPANATTAQLRFTEHPPGAVHLNPALVINAPRCLDGRSVRIPRIGPVRLDIPEGAPLSHDALAPHRGRGIDPLLDGLDLYALAGEGPGVVGEIVGDALLLHHEEPRDPETRSVLWVRRTDGAAGSVGTGAVRLVASPARAALRVLVNNPYALRGGQDRETPPASISRIYGGGFLPLSSFEGVMTDVLSAAGLPWHVQLWSPLDARTHELRTWSELPLVVPRAGPPEMRTTAAGLLQPGTLVAAVGPVRQPATAEDHERAREILQAWFETARVPHAALRALTILPLRTLRALTRRNLLTLRLPTPSLSDLDQGDQLEDTWAERRKVRVDALLVDALVSDAAALERGP